MPHRNQVAAVVASFEAIDDQGRPLGTMYSECELHYEDGKARVVSLTFAVDDGQLVTYCGLNNEEFGVSDHSIQKMLHHAGERSRAMLAPESWHAWVEKIRLVPPSDSQLQTVYEQMTAALLIDGDGNAS